MTDAATPRKLAPWMRTGVDYLGPLAFVIGYFVGGRDVLHATWWLVGGSVVALAILFAVERRLAPMPAIWGGAALVFGLLTLVFHDPRIIKMKTTFIDLALGLAMFGGLYLKKNPLKAMMGEAIPLSDEGWRKMTLRYGLFFVAMAVLNEIIWRTQPDAVWVLFRMPGLLILAVLFAATQVPSMLKEAKRAEAAAALAELQE